MSLSFVIGFHCSSNMKIMNVRNSYCCRDDHEFILPFYPDSTLNPIRIAEKHFEIAIFCLSDLSALNGFSLQIGK